MNAYLSRVVVFSIPLFIVFLLILTPFFILDPFKILKPYPVYYESEIGYNVDYVSTERYLKNTAKYDSFIFGSSRAGSGFRVNHWRHYLPQSDQPFSFAASSETIFGIWGKINLIDQKGTSLKNALVIIDPDVTFSNYINSSGHLYIKHPMISKESRNDFISEFIKDFIFTGFFIRYYDYLIFHKQRPYMAGYLKFKDVHKGRVYVPFNVSGREAEIKNDKAFYSKHRKLFYERGTTQKYYAPKITATGIQYLNDIKQIFHKNNTSYKIVISPLYNQMKMNPKDYNILTRIFGEKNIYDFSGINQITSDKRNYYESSHYRVRIGDKIMKSIYTFDSINVSKN